MDEEKEFFLSYKTLYGGERLVGPFTARSSVVDVKRTIQADRNDAPVDRQQLIFKRIMMDNRSSLVDYGIDEPGLVVHLVMALRGS